MGSSLSHLCACNQAVSSNGQLSHCTTSDTTTTLCVQGLCYFSRNKPAILEINGISIPRIFSALYLSRSPQNTHGAPSTIWYNSSQSGLSSAMPRKKSSLTAQKPFSLLNLPPEIYCCQGRRRHYFPTATAEIYEKPGTEPLTIWQSVPAAKDGLIANCTCSHLSAALS